MATTTPRQDSQTVTADSRPILNLIDGVILRSLTTHVDERGTLVELYSPAWGVNGDPMTFLYSFTIMPGMVKGWGVHRLHTDRIVQLSGRVRYVLYDDRPDSPTFGMVNDFYLSEFDRRLIVIPADVWHLLWNVGTEEAVLINFPTRTYNHADPDIYRLPPNNDYIPYHIDFDTRGR